MFLPIAKKGLVKTAEMLYNISNTYYTTLFCVFQEQIALFCKKRSIQIKETERRH